MFITEEFWPGLISIAIGYLLGSFPTAYLITKWRTGKDIRELGGGNVGGLNTFKEVGRIAGIAVVIIDLAKGSAAVLVTYFLLHYETPYVLMSSLGAVMGHNWSLWLKLTGGKGMGAMVGGFVTIIPLYGHLKELGVFLGIILIVVAITRNVALSNGVALVGLPFICWLSIHSATFVIWSIALGLIIAAKFLPTALRALAKDSNIKHYIKGS